MLDARVREQFGLSWGKARAAIESGKVFVDGAACTDATMKPGENASIELRVRAPRPRPGRLEKASIAWLDAHVVVVDKPAGLATVPYREDEPDNLERRVREYLTHQSSSRAGVAPLGVVHRIDKETSGLVVFTRTWLGKQSLASQFRAHTTHRKYLAIAHGVVASGTIRSDLVDNRGDGLRGSAKGRPPPGAQHAVTHIEALEALEGATLIACTLETGRTHQIRIHLAESGHPLLGERVYIRGYRGDEIPAPRLMLHAAELGFVHPATEQDVRFERPAPKDFAETLARLSRA